MKKFFLLFSLLSLSFIKYYQLRYRGFCEAFLETKAPKNICFSSIDPSFYTHLDKPFYYMACGRQTYVFSQKNAPFVLKILSYKPLVSKPLYQDKIKVFSNIKKDLRSYLIAFDQLKKESGLIGIKIGKTTHLPKITLQDPLGISRIIDLNQIDFLVQLKASPLGDLPMDASIISQVKSLIELRLEKNIQDTDPRIHRNLGLVDGNPIFLDVGSFKIDHVLSTDEKRDEITKIFDYHKEHLKQKAL